MNLILIGLLFLVISCGVTNTGNISLGGVSSQSFVHNVPFTTGTNANYVLSSTSVEIDSNLVRLRPNLHIDDSNVPAGFAGGTLNGVFWDAINGYLRLNSTSNIFEHDASWTPKYADVIAYYKLNEASYNGTINEVIDSVGGHHGTASAGTFTNTTGRVNNAAVFDGTNVISMGDVNALEGLSTFSVAFWVKPQNLNGVDAPGIVTKRTSFGNDESFNFFLWTDQKLFIDIAGNDQRFSTFSTFENDRWYHVVITFDGNLAAANRVSVYVNGHHDITSTEGSTIIPNFGADLLFGLLSGASNYHGQLDEVIFWNETLSESEVKFIHDRQRYKYTGEFVSRVMDGGTLVSPWNIISPVTPLPYSKELPGDNGSETTTHYTGMTPNLMTGLLAYWKLNENGGGANNMTDHSGNNNHGTTSGTIELADPRGLFNGAALFRVGKIAVNNTLLNNLPEFSISGWISPNYKVNGAATTDISIFGKDDLIEVSMENGLLCANSVNDVAKICTATPIQIGEWNHIMVTGSTTTFSFYLNGELVGFAAHAGADYGSNANSFNLGSEVRSAAAETYLGLMDEVAVWNRDLSLSEIQSIYRRGANTILYQVRSCMAVDCSDQEALLNKGWKGPGNDYTTFFSENSNTGLTPLSLSFADFPLLTVATNRYFQYRAIFRSTDTENLCDYGTGTEMCSPELNSMTVGPSFVATEQTITNNVAIGAFFTTLSGFTESLGSNGCTGGARYTISNDGATFYYLSGASWVTSNNTWAEASTATNINARISAFPVSIGTGTLQVKTFLISDGLTTCEVDNVRVTGSR